MNEKEKLNEAKALIDAGKYEEAKAKLDEVIAYGRKQDTDLSDDKPTIGGGGVDLPNKK